MSVFQYKARNINAEYIEGEVEAPSLHVAEELLGDKGLTVVELGERRRGVTRLSIGIFNRVPKKELVVFARELAVMIDANIPLVRALKILQRQTENVTLKILLSKVSDDVDGGARLSQALGRYPQVFDDFFTQMVRAAETTGRLDETLTYLADQREKDYELMRSIRGSLIYPCFILGGLVVVGAIMMIFVVPNLTSILQETGAELPFATRMLITSSDFFSAYWWLILTGVILLFILYRAYYRTRNGKEVIDAAKIRIPIMGKLFQRLFIARFSRSLSTLIASGVPISKSLEIVADVIGNESYRRLTIATIKDVEDGKSIVSQFATSKSVPPMLTQMLRVGEESGKLDHVLQKVADFYSKEVDASVKNLVNFIEPMVIAILGIAVGFLILSILLPLYSMTANF
ncbi:MAG: type II secretion system F family protein [Candidatus Kerfeldbacteria bacterium]|nr:type II secretion system F family protein [Candidatus Kerfeldbacteria bacterium]